METSVLMRRTVQNDAEIKLLGDGEMREVADKEESKPALPWHPALPFFPSAFASCPCDHLNTKQCTYCWWTPEGEIMVFDEQDWRWFRITWRSIIIDHGDHGDYTTEAIYYPA